MAETHTEGRAGTITVHSDSYGITRIVGPVEPTEDPAQWKARKATDAELLKRFGWTTAQLTTARAALGFPEGQLATTTDWFPKQIRVTFERDVDRWEEQARFVGLLK